MLFGSISPITKKQPNGLIHRKAKLKSTIGTGIITEAFARERKKLFIIIMDLENIDISQIRLETRISLLKHARKS